MAERSDPQDPPTGMPEEGDEITPLGPGDADPEGEGETPRGDDAQPGIPTEGEPPAAS
jgi:hypothetical protein